MSSGAKAPAFQFYTKEWLSSATVRLMTLAARGLFIDMLARQWEDGALPDDPIKVARMVAAQVDEVERAWPEVRAKFVAVEGGWIVNQKLADQRAEYERFRRQRRQASALGVEARTGRRPAKRKSSKAATGPPSGQPHGQPSGIPDGEPSGQPLQSASASALRIEKHDLELPTDQGETIACPAELADRIITLFAEAREKPEIAHRNTSAIHDEDEQFRMVNRFLSRLFPPPMGATQSREVMRWMGRIPLERAAIAVREIERSVYPNGSGDRAWSDLTEREQKQLVISVFNGMESQT